MEDVVENVKFLKGILYKWKQLKVIVIRSIFIIEYEMFQIYGSCSRERTRKNIQRRGSN